MLKALLISSLLLAISLSAGAQTPAEPHAKLERMEVFPDIARDHLKKRVEPSYPPLARKERVQGLVVLHIVADKQGNVKEAKAESGPTALRRAAIDAVKQWKYKPFTYKGDPVEMETKVTVQFRLLKAR